MRSLYLLMSFFLVAVAGVVRAAPSNEQLVYLATWPHQLIVFDSVSEKIVDNVDLKSDITPNLVLSADKKQLYALTNGQSREIVTVDLATRKVIGSFSLNEGNRNVRVSAMVPDPTGRYLYGLANIVSKQLDRYEVEPPKFVVIDLMAQKITHMVDFPKEEGFLDTRAQIKLSANGKNLYVFRDKILVFETAGFTLVKKIDLAQPPVADMQNLTFNTVADPNEQAGEMTGLFTSADPYVHRRVFGIARINLEQISFEFTPVGPETYTMTGLFQTPDRKLGYSVVTTNPVIGNLRYEFWAFDMRTGRIVNKREFEGRNRLSQFAISADGTKLFISGAGYQLEVYDAQTLELRSVVEMPGDLAGNLVVMPLAATSSAISSAPGRSAAFSFSTQ
jgi:hypothetical protein